MNETEKKLLDEIVIVLENHPDFDPPFFRTDGGDKGAQEIG